MEEMKGMTSAINALGNRIAELEQALYYEQLCRENAEKRAADLKVENESLAKKVRAVEAYIEREVG